MGILYIVATPIGNLEDITLRAIRILKEVDFIISEDTRQTKKLLGHYKIGVPTISYHQHSREKKVDFILELLKSGKNLALVTDAGTPCISDPGGKLVDEVNKVNEEIEGKIMIVPIPGPSAVVAAASVSGMPLNNFLFLGFPPHKKGRSKFFKKIKESYGTVIFYESRWRILRTLEQLSESVENRKIVVCRELTKKFESIYRGNIREVIDKLKADKIKGEFVVIINSR